MLSVKSKQFLQSRKPRSLGQGWCGKVLSSVFFRYWEAISLSPALHGVGVTRLRPGAELNPAKAGNVA
ncbi:MAG: hypothetical protein QXV53_06715, partial [Zestosphaera sp.]